MRTRHSRLCAACLASPLTMALQPKHPSVGPCSWMSFWNIFHRRVSGCSGIGCGTYSSVFVSSGANLRANAGDLQYDCPGTGCFGLPLNPNTLSLDHRSCIARLRMSVTLNTPTGVPMRDSVDLMSKPRYTPLSHWSSDLPGLSLV